MKKNLFLIIAILFCKETIADPPYNIHSAAKGNDVEHEAFVQKLISDLLQDLILIPIKDTKVTLIESSKRTKPILTQKPLLKFPLTKLRALPL